MRGSFLPNGSVKAFRKSKVPWANPRVGVDRALLAGAPRASPFLIAATRRGARPMRVTIPFAESAGRTIRPAPPRNVGQVEFAA